MSYGCADDLCQEVELLLLFHFCDLDVFGRSAELFNAARNVIICHHSRRVSAGGLSGGFETCFEV